MEGVRVTMLLPRYSKPHHIPLPPPSQTNFPSKLKVEEGRVARGKGRMVGKVRVEVRVVVFVAHVKGMVWTLVMIGVFAVTLGMPVKVPFRLSRGVGILGERIPEKQASPQI